MSRNLAPLLRLALVVSWPTSSPAVANEPESDSRILNILHAIEEDEDFIQRNYASINTLREKNNFPVRKMLDMRRKIVPEPYLDAAVEFLNSKLEKSEIAEISAYFESAQNTRMYRLMVNAFKMNKGEALRLRNLSLERNHPTAWSATTTFFRTPAARKFSQLLNDLETIRVEQSIAIQLKAYREVFGPVPEN